MFFKQVKPGTSSRLTLVDHEETYGRHILASICKKIVINKAVDLGCGAGKDLEIVRKYHPNSELFGIDFEKSNKIHLSSIRVNSIALNIENEKLPFENNSVDLVIANQVLEHTKEIYWINHEIFRILKVGGYLYLGVPNILSLHNRLLGLIGIHPTSAKIISAHVRVFSIKDTILYYHTIAHNFCEIQDIYGSQFYPFPKLIARPLSSVFPSLAFSIFFLIRKTNNYNSEFIKWLSISNLETNFYTGAN